MHYRFDQNAVIAVANLPGMVIRAVVPRGLAQFCIIQHYFLSEKVASLQSAELGPINNLNSPASALNCCLSFQ